jgi:hypothetical protein
MREETRERMEGVEVDMGEELERENVKYEREHKGDIKVTVIDEERERNIEVLVQNFRYANFMMEREDEEALEIMAQELRRVYEGYSDMKLANMVLINC